VGDEGRSMEDTLEDASLMQGGNMNELFQHIEDSETFSPNSRGARNSSIKNSSFYRKNGAVIT